MSVICVVYIFMPAFRTCIPATLVSLPLYHLMPAFRAPLGVCIFVVLLYDLFRILALHEDVSELPEQVAELCDFQQRPPYFRFSIRDRCNYVIYANHSRIVIERKQSRIQGPHYSIPRVVESYLDHGIYFFHFSILSCSVVPTFGLWHPAV